MKMVMVTHDAETEPFNDGVEAKPEAIGVSFQEQMLENATLPSVL